MRNLIRLSYSVFECLHNAIITKFLEKYPSPNLPDYVLYGYGDYGSKDSLRNEIIDKYKQHQFRGLPKSFRAKDGAIKYSGKYLRDKFKSSEGNNVEINKDYLASWLFYLDFQNIEEFKNHFIKIGELEKTEATVSTDTKKEEQVNRKLIYTCYYFSNGEKKVKDFTLTIKKHKAEVNWESSGKSFTGEINKTNKDQYNKSITLYSNNNIKGELYLTIGGTENFHQRAFSIGYYLSYTLDSDSCAGPFLMECATIGQLLNTAKTANSEKININEYKNGGTDYLVKLLLGQKKIAANLDKKLKKIIIGSLYNLISEEIISKRIDDSVALANLIVRLKNAQFGQFLNGKQAKLDNAYINNFLQFQNQLNAKYPGWEQNRSIQRTLTGYYVMYMGSWQPNEYTGEKVKKLEQFWLYIKKNGKVSCKTCSGGTFEGVLSVIDQKIAFIDLQKIDSKATYKIILRTPEDFARKGENPILKGVLGGISRNIKPRADKILLRQISEEEKGNIKFKPKYLDLINNADIIEEIATSIPGFKSYFSVDARDKFLQDSNLLFSNPLYLSNSDSLAENVGIYEYYRLNREHTVIKKYPIRIEPNGTATMYRQDTPLKGKALIYDKRMVIHFFNNGHKKFDATIFFPLLTKPIEKTVGMLISASNLEESFCHTIWIVKNKEEKNPYYDSLRLEASPELINEKFKGDQEFENASYVLFSRPSTLFTRDYELRQFGNHKYHLSEQKEKALSRQIDTIVLAVLKGQRPIAEKYAKRMINGWKINKDWVSAYLHEHYDTRLQNEVIENVTALFELEQPGLTITSPLSMSSINTLE